MTAAVIILTVVVALLMLERLLERRRDNELIALCDRLCQRIQAPQAAVIEHDEQVRALRDEEYAPPAVAPEDDDGYWMSREKLAELAMEQETSGRN